MHHLSRPLPYDIVSIILSQFIPDSGTKKRGEQLSRFAALAIVCRDWDHYVRRNLYQDVLLEGMGEYGTGYAKWGAPCCMTLRSFPSLADIVRTCTITSLEPSGQHDSETELLCAAIKASRNLISLHLHDMNIPFSLLQAIATLDSLESISIKCCTFDAPCDEPTKFTFALRNLSIHGTPLLGHEAVVEQLLGSKALVQLSVDSNITDVAIDVMCRGNIPALRQLYAEPSRQSSSRFTQAVLCCPSLHTLRFSHGLKSLVLDPIDFYDLRTSSIASSLIDFLGPSALLRTILGHGPNTIQRVVLDQIVALDESEPDGIVYRPRNLAISPDIEAARIIAIRNFLSAPRRLEYLNIVLSSPKHLEEMMPDNRVYLEELRVNCTAPEEFETGLSTASSALSQMHGLKYLWIGIPTGYKESALERDLQQQLTLLQQWTAGCPSLRRVGFSGWLEWNRQEGGEWVPSVIKNAIGSQKIARWRRAGIKTVDVGGLFSSLQGSQTIPAVHCQMPLTISHQIMPPVRNFGFG